MTPAKRWTAAAAASVASLIALAVLAECDSRGAVVVAVWALLLSAALTSGAAFYRWAPRRPWLAAAAGGSLVGVFAFFAVLYIGLFRCGVD